MTHDTWRTCDTWPFFLNFVLGFLLSVLLSYWFGNTRKPSNLLYSIEFLWCFPISYQLLHKYASAISVFSHLCALGQHRSPDLLHSCDSCKHTSLDYTRLFPQRSPDWLQTFDSFQYRGLDWLAWEDRGSFWPYCFSSSARLLYSSYFGFYSTGLCFTDPAGCPKTQPLLIKPHWVYSSNINKLLSSLNCSN